MEASRTLPVCRSPFLVSVLHTVNLALDDGSFTPPSFDCPPLTDFLRTKPKDSVVLKSLDVRRSRDDVRFQLVYLFLLRTLNISPLTTREVKVGFVHSSVMTSPAPKSLAPHTFRPNPRSLRSRFWARRPPLLAVFFSPQKEPLTDSIDLLVKRSPFVPNPDG